MDFFGMANDMSGPHGLSHVLWDGAGIMTGVGCEVGTLGLGTFGCIAASSGVAAGGKLATDIAYDLYGSS